MLHNWCSTHLFTYYLVLGIWWSKIRRVTSMFVTDFEDEMCWSPTIFYMSISDRILMLVTSFEFWSLMPHHAPKFKRCHQHQGSVANIQKLSPTSSHNHHDVPNITITLGFETFSPIFPRGKWSKIFATGSPAKFQKDLLSRNFTFLTNKNVQALKY